jgi:peptide/nickel transport system permease protein
MGLLLLEAVSQRDYPIITGVFPSRRRRRGSDQPSVDLSYGLLDPKVRYR